VYKILLLILPCFILHGQNFPKGAYMSFNEVRQKSPSSQCELIIKESGVDVNNKAGINDYQLAAPSRCISKSAIRKEMWAYSDGNSLYFNCRHLRKDAAYTKVLTFGRFLAFYENENSGEKAAITAIGSVLGPPGAMVGYAIGYAFENQEPGRYLNVIDMDSAKLFYLDSAFLSVKLKDYPALYENFKSDLYAGNEEQQLMYVESMNKANRPKE
jgi:hypothetical protein